MPKHPDKPMKWTAEQLQALALTFEGRWTHAEIAEKCSISPRTYAYWLQHPDFQERLDELRKDLSASLRAVAYADKAQRIIGLSQMAESARREYEARPRLKEVRPTRDGFIINEAFNQAAHDAYRAALADIAAELGQRKNVTEIGGALDVTERVTFYLPQPEEEPPDDALG